MLKILLVMMATAVFVLFGIQNSDHVQVSFVVGAPKQVRLVFLLMLAGVAGFIVSYISSLNREIRLKREVRRMTEEQGEMPKWLRPKPKKRTRTRRAG